MNSTYAHKDRMPTQKLGLHKALLNSKENTRPHLLLVSLQYAI